MKKTLLTLLAAILLVATPLTSAKAGAEALLPLIQSNGKVFFDLAKGTITIDQVQDTKIKAGVKTFCAAVCGSSTCSKSAELTAVCWNLCAESSVKNCVKKGLEANEAKVNKYSDLIVKAVNPEDFIAQLTAIIGAIQ